MLMLVMSNNFLQLFFGWEAVGLVSYLLIGFWYKRPDGDLRQPEGLPGQPRRRLRLHPRHRPDRWRIAGTLDYAEVFAKAPAAGGKHRPFPGTDVAC